MNDGVDSVGSFHVLVDVLRIHRVTVQRLGDVICFVQTQRDREIVVSTEACTCTVLEIFMVPAERGPSQVPTPYN